MKLELILPYIMMSEAILCSITYGCMGNYNKALYWVAGATITWTVTRM